MTAHYPRVAPLRYQTTWNPAKAGHSLAPAGRPPRSRRWQVQQVTEPKIGTLGCEHDLDRLAAELAFGESRA